MRLAAAEHVRRRLDVVRPQQLQAEDDSVEQVAHVVGDHGQEVVAVRDDFVGTGTLGQEIRVRGRPLVHQERVERVRLVLAVAAEGDIRGGAFPADVAVGLGSLADDGAGFPVPAERLVVFLEASGAQDGVRDASGLIDHVVGIAVGGGVVALQGVVGVLPLGAEAVVRLRALSRPAARPRGSTRLYHPAAVSHGRRRKTKGSP